MPAAGRQDHRERDEPDEPEPRLRKRDDDEEQREVVQPHDRGQCERCGDREDERAPLVAARPNDDGADQEPEAEGQPDSARDRRRQPEVEPDDVRGVRVLADDVLEPRRRSG